MSSIKGYAALFFGVLITILVVFLIFSDNFTWGPLYSSDGRDGEVVLLLLFVGLSSFALGIGVLHISKTNNEQNQTAISQLKHSKESNPMGSFLGICLLICCVWSFVIGFQVLDTGILPQGKGGAAFDVKLDGLIKYIIGSILMIPLCVLLVNKIKKYRKS